MKTKQFLFFAANYLLCLTPFLHGQQSARIEEFSPQATVKNVRQVRARFSSIALSKNQLLSTVQKSSAV
jgi:hypothetical protein